MAGRFETLDVDGSVMPVYLAGNAGGAGVLVCMHAPGVDDFIQDICHRLADSGFVAAAPDLYHRQRAGDLNPLDYDFHRYDGAGHAFLNFMRPSLREEAAADAWARCSGFLQAHA